MYNFIKIFSILILALSLRLIPSYINIDNTRSLTDDSARYLELSESFLKTRSFKLSENSKNHTVANPWNLEVFRGIAYPFMLGIFNNDFNRIIIFQIILDLILIVVVFYVLNLSGISGTLAALILAIDPSLITASNLIMSDTLFAFLFGIALLIFIFARRKKTFTAVLLSIMSLVRPVGFLLGSIWSLLILIKSKRLILALIFLLISSSIPAILLVRNYTITKTLTLSSAWEYNYYIYFAAQIKSDQNATNLNDEVNNLEKCVHNNLQTVPWIESLKICGSPYLKFDSVFFRRVFKNLIYMNFAPERKHLFQILGLEDSRTEPINFFSTRGILLAIQMIYICTLWLFILIAIYRLLRQRNYNLLSILIPTLLYFEAVSLIVASARMRVPFVIILALLLASIKPARRITAQFAKINLRSKSMQGIS